MERRGFRDSLPLTINGKIDMSHLPTLSEIQSATQASERAGHGCFGDVFRYGPYAIKRIRIDPQYSKMIEREKAILEWIRTDPTPCPFLINYHKCYQDTTFLYLLFDWVDAKLEISGQRPFAEAQRVLKQLAEGLRYLHSKNLEHRNITPDNILLTSFELTSAIVKITDFGFAKLLRPYVVHAGDFGIFNPYYMAPEIFFHMQGHYGCKVDVWSFGVVAFELLTGHKPFPGRTMAELKDRRRKGVPRGEFPQGFEQVCQDFVDFCLVTPPQQRPTMEEVLRHRFFDFSPRLYSAVQIVREADGLVEQIQRFQYYLIQAGLMQASENLKEDTCVLLFSLKNTCLHVKRQLEDNQQDSEEVDYVLLRIEEAEEANFF